MQSILNTVLLVILATASLGAANPVAEPQLNGCVSDAGLLCDPAGTGLLPCCPGLTCTTIINLLGVAVSTRLYFAIGSNRDAEHDS